MTIEDGGGGEREREGIVIYAEKEEDRTEDE